jgi:membrane protease YdiL (CAAX protease family)
MGATEGLSLNSMAESAGILSDNDSLCVMSKQENLSQLIAAGPVREEFATRLLPGILLAKNWRVGVFSSTAFAYMHQLRGIQTDRHGISIDIDFAKLPTGHFIAGLYYWKVFKDRGLLHSIAAHATTNTLAAISGWIHCPTENPSNRVEN